MEGALTNTDQTFDFDRRQGRDGPLPTQPPCERAVLVGIDLPGNPWKLQDSLEELAQLALTADVQPVGIITQKLPEPIGRTFIGKGKLNDLAALCDATDATVVLFDDELSPSQERNLEERLDRKIVDRTALILDIFARRALTREGRLQVELAQLEYRLPRLTRMWTHLSRQGVGGVGLRGPGETQLEVDRRRAREQINRIKQEIEQVRSHRRLNRSKRREDGFPVVSLVGYTNAGKSTLLNRLADASIVAENKLFATLDPTTRQVVLPGGTSTLWTDTVGFIQKLPTELVAAFRATLEEINEADVLVHVVDATHENAQEQANAVDEVLKYIGIHDKPVILALNKVDLLAPSDGTVPVGLDFGQDENTVLISAEKGWGIEELLRRVEHILEGRLEEMWVNLPYARSALVDLFHKHGQILEEDFNETGTEIHGRIPERFIPSFRPYTNHSR